MKPTIHYRNTDLELVSTCDLTPLADVLSAKGLLQLQSSRREDGFWYATFETDDEFDDPELNILEFLTVIEAIDTHFQSIWSACTTREFDIGYDSGDEPWGFHSCFATSTLARVVAAGASIRLTLYPADRSSRPSHDNKSEIA